MRRWLALLIAAGAALAVAQTSVYQLTLPTGWTRGIEDGIETLLPSAEPAGTVQALLLPPKPLAADFDAQFAAERAALEAHWGLQRPQAVPLQAGRTDAGPYAAHFASYASEGGPRYMSFLALGRQGRFVMLVFVASSDDAFNRLAPQVTQLWWGLQVAP
jgi:hypothetical protein